ncbi:MAG: hypothetical protein L0Y36_01240 [Planctomycetales bacterium]|nr:hypothetical protein [Planctomycetales bacterium]
MGVILMQQSDKGFWQHIETGQIYAVKSTPFGEVIGADGPLDPANLRDLNSYKYGKKILLWMQRAVANNRLRRINPETPGAEPPQELAGSVKAHNAK